MYQSNLSPRNLRALLTLRNRLVVAMAEQMQASEERCEAELLTDVVWLDPKHDAGWITLLRAGRGASFGMRLDESDPAALVVEPDCDSDLVGGPTYDALWQDACAVARALDAAVDADHEDSDGIVKDRCPGECYKLWNWGDGDTWMADLLAGKDAKLTFDHPDSVENMWVENVRQKADGTFEGELLNTPCGIPIEPGHTVAFKHCHVRDTHVPIIDVTDAARDAAVKAAKVGDEVALLHDADGTPVMFTRVADNAEGHKVFTRVGSGAKGEVNRIEVEHIADAESAVA